MTLQQLVTQICSGLPLDEAVRSLFEAVCPSCSNPRAYVNLRGAVDCPEAGCVHHIAYTKPGGKSFLSDYNKWAAGDGKGTKNRALFKTMVKALKDWVKRFTHNDANKARKAMAAVLDPLLLPKGLTTDFFKDLIDDEEPTAVEYTIMSKTKGLRSGAPGGDHLITVMLMYHPDGKESYDVNAWAPMHTRGSLSLDDLFGQGSYADVRIKLKSELRKVFPDKLNTYDFDHAHSKRGIHVP